MLTAEGCLTRRQRLLEQVDVDLLLISNPRHVQYLSGFHISQLALSRWGPNHLLIERSGRCRLLVHNFIAAEAEKAHVDEVIVWRWYDSATQAGLPVFREGARQLNDLLGRLTFGRVGYEAGLVPREVNLGDNVFDLTDTLLQMRRIKYPDELELQRAAIHAVEAGHAAARRVIRPGVTEVDVYNAIFAAIQQSCGGPVLPLGDFVSGERTYTIGGPPTDRALASGELMILDIFPIIDGYRADFTATVAVSDQLTPRQEDLEAALHEALAAGERELRPGAKTRDIYYAIRNKLDELNFGAGFVHHAGHGLGLGHPEAPYLVPESDETLLAGEVITLEPGSYGVDFGARIEHNYLIQEDGYQRLTRHPTAFVTRT